MSDETTAELFAKDPLSLTKSDITEIISYYRANREKFIASGQSGVRGGTKPVTKPVKSKSGPLPDLDLGDLKL